MRARIVLIAFAAAAIAPMLLACAGTQANPNSPDYEAGYGDGCATGQSRGTYPPQPPVRDNSAFNHNADYKSGWRAGYNACLVRRGGDPFGPP